MSEQANRYAVIGLATSLAGCILGIVLVRLFGHDEPTFLIQLAMVIASGLIGYIGGQAAAPPRRPAGITVEVRRLAARVTARGTAGTATSKA